MEFFYTHANGRTGSSHVLHMFDGSICNMDSLFTSTKTSCQTLPKVRSDHYSLRHEFKFSTTL